MAPDDPLSDRGEKTKKKFKRKLTPFLCQEMLYDYALDRLDPDRKAAVSDFLQSDQECRGILEGIRLGLAYAERLGRTLLAEEVEKNLRESENAISLGKKYSSWQEWPEVVRWSLTAIFLSSAVALIVAVIPWSKMPSFRSKKADTIEIAQLGRPPEKAIEEAQEHQEGENASEEGSGDEEIEAPDAAAVIQAGKRPPSGSDDEGDEEDAPALVKKSNEKPAPRPTAAGLANTPPLRPPGRPDQAVALNSSGGTAASSPGASVAGSALSVAGTAGTKSVSDNDDASSRHEAKAKGFVFRAFMTLGNLDEIGPKITENITELGGEKAGEVELGWKRGTGRYYHFAIPEDNEERLLEKLRAYGPVRISKDPHPRVMPAGQIRVILWVESAK